MVITYDVRRSITAKCNFGWKDAKFFRRDAYLMNDAQTRFVDRQEMDGIRFTVIFSFYIFFYYRPIINGLFCGGNGTQSNIMQQWQRG